VPGLKVVMPSTPADAKGLLKSAIRDEDPVVFIEHKLLYMTEGDVPDDEGLVPLGVADVKRAGDDVTLVAWSHMLTKCLKAADELATEGISVEVIDPRTLAPLDLETIVASVQRTGRLVVAQEAPLRGGVAGEIAAEVSERAWEALRGPVVRVAGLDTPIPFNLALEQVSIPQVADIRAAVRRAVGHEITAA